MLAGHVFITRPLQPTANPIRLRFFGANAEILAPDHVARLIHGLAPAGTLTAVVVCIPFVHVQLMVSPTAAFTVLGVNTKLDTVTG